MYNSTKLMYLKIKPVFNIPIKEIINIYNKQYTEYKRGKQNKFRNISLYQLISYICKHIKEKRTDNALPAL